MSKSLTLAQKKDLLYSYYMSGEYNNKELAQMSGLSAVTVGKCIIEGKWKERKEAISVTCDNQLKMFITQLNALNKHINDRDEGNKFPNSKEADTQIKLTNAIEKLKGNKDLTDTIEVMEGFIRFVQKEYPEKLKELVSISREFIIERA